VHVCIAGSRKGGVSACIADKEELVAKIQHLEQRLNDRKEALLEKELILEEVTALSDKLRAQVCGGPGRAPDRTSTGV